MQIALTFRKPSKKLLVSKQQANKHALLIHAKKEKKITQTDQTLGNPQLVDLFNHISLYVSELKTGSASSLQHKTKRRRLDDSNVTEISTPDEYVNGSTKGADDEEESEDVLLAVQDISVVIPQRKKYTIEFTKTRIRARDPKTNELVASIGCRWADIGLLIPFI